jgi:membrane associated rhomboid family serine protease
VYLAILISMFLHGSLLHLGGNMLFLWIFGNNIEDTLGRAKYLAFYLVGGFVATMAHILVQPQSTIPTIGASGAIAAVMGAYLAWFPNVRIRTLFIFFFVLFRDISAKWLLLFWFFSQFLEGVNPNSGVAWMAHVGGFAFGLLFGFVFRTNRAAGRPALRGSY